MKKKKQTKQKKEGSVVEGIVLIGTILAATLNFVEGQIFNAIAFFLLWMYIVNLLTKDEEVK